MNYNDKRGSLSGLCPASINACTAPAGNAGDYVTGWSLLRIPRPNTSQMCSIGDRLGCLADQGSAFTPCSLRK